MMSCTLERIGSTENCPVDERKPKVFCASTLILVMEHFSYARASHLSETIAYRFGVKESLIIAGVLLTLCLFCIAVRKICQPIVVFALFQD